MAEHGDDGRLLGIAREHWGKGFAAEGAAVCMDYVFDVLNWTEVTHAIAPDNRRSIAVAQRLGSSWQRQSRLPAPLANVSVDLYGQSREQWRARKADRAAGSGDGGRRDVGFAAGPTPDGSGQCSIE